MATNNPTSRTFVLQRSRSPPPARRRRALTRARDREQSATDADGGPEWCASATAATGLGVPSAVSIACGESVDRNTRGRRAHASSTTESPALLNVAGRCSVRTVASSERKLVGLSSRPLGLGGDGHAERRMRRGWAHVLQRPPPIGSRDDRCAYRLRKVSSVSVWLPPASMARTSTLYSVRGWTNSAGTVRRVAVAGRSALKTRNTGSSWTTRT
jgi:hypothetical protein